MEEMNKKEKLMMGGLELPDELVLSSILPLLPMKDVARYSVVSRGWLSHWRNTPILSFHDPGMLNTMIEAVQGSFRVITDARRKFIRWVNNVVAKHVGGLLEEFQVVYFFDIIHQVYIDRWVAWALSKHVQRLSLDFTATYYLFGYQDPQRHYYVLDRTLFESSNTTKLCLTSLCLKGVNVDTETVDYLLRACASTLEKLCIVKSEYLTSIAAASLPALKCLMLADCPKLEIVDIQAPKLVSLTYESVLDPILRVFEIRNASNLCYAKINVTIEERFWFVLCSVSEYLWHLEDLRLEWRANPHFYQTSSTWNSLLMNPVIEHLLHGFPSLRHVLA